MYHEALPANCPPETATEVNKVLFRIANSNNISENEFKSYMALNPENKRYKDICIAYGVSLWNKKELAVEAYEKAQLRNKTLGNYILEVQITENCGKCLSDGKHDTVWFYNGVDFSSIAILSTEEIK